MQCDIWLEKGKINVQSGLFQKRTVEAEGKDDCMLARIAALEEKLSKAEGGASEFDQAQAQVRRMLGRISLVQPHIVLATLEVLVETAQRGGHKEADYYKAAFAEARRHETDEGFGQLVTQLFGSAEDKRVASALTNWHKVVKAESGVAKQAQQHDSLNPQQAQMQPAFYAPAPPSPFYMPSRAPFKFYQPFYGQQGNARRGGSLGVMRRPPKSREGQGSACYGCGEQGHRVADCQALKDFRANKK